MCVCFRLVTCCLAAIFTLAVAGCESGADQSPADETEVAVPGEPSPPESTPIDDSQSVPAPAAPSDDVPGSASPVVPGSPDVTQEIPAAESDTQMEGTDGADDSNDGVSDSMTDTEEPGTDVSILAAGGAGGSDASSEATDVVGTGGAMPDLPQPVGDAGPPSGRMTAYPIGESDAPLGYWEYLPPGYGDGPVPLLVFTHGAAWQGEGTLETLQALLEVGPPNLISTDTWPNERPFIVLSPQNPRSGCFDAGDIDAFYHYAVEHYDVDIQRIYHTGQSCGAIGAWNYLAEHLDEFVTAAVLISGDGRAAFEQAGCELGRVAIWGLHNENDSSVSSTGTIDPINGLLACEPTPDVQLTIYPGETAHDAWTKTYDLSAGNDIYSWLLEHVHP